jgi:hypothetical protein
LPLLHKRPPSSQQGLTQQSKLDNVWYHSL